MDTRPSYYLQSNQDEFSELDAETRQLDTSDVPYVTPANDVAGQNDAETALSCIETNIWDVRRTAREPAVNYGIVSGRSLLASTRARSQSMISRPGYCSAQPL